MPYREDLDAALAHAEAAERSLEDARKESEADHARIAELEAALARAKRGVQETQSREPRHPPPRVPRDRAKPDKSTQQPWIVMACVGAVLLVGALIAYAVGTQGVKVAVDVSRDLAAARREARGMLPDPVLTSISADLVNPQGVVDLVKYDGSMVTYGFASPSRTAVPAPVGTGPIGAPQPTPQYANCSVSIRYLKDRVKTYSRSGRGTQTCGEPIPTGAPHCSAADVWAEAIRRGAPTNALASLRFSMPAQGSAKTTVAHHDPTWSFSIAGTAFNYTIPDDCPFPR
jgi:hypothetical protein